MPTTMALWRLNDAGSATPVAAERLAAEALIKWLWSQLPELLGDEVLIVGRQVSTPSGPLDLLALDTEGRLVVIENKRDRTPGARCWRKQSTTACVATMTFDDVRDALRELPTAIRIRSDRSRRGLRGAIW